jgi:ABC-type transport system involved in multi-copper enzyme maturation permease subunit
MSAHLFDIAWLTIREAARRRLFLVLILITAASVALSAWGFSQVRDALLSEVDGAGGAIEAGGVTGELALTFIFAQLLILVTFMFSFILALSAVFIAAPVIAGELESGVALTILARPIGRTTYLFGKWLGIAILVCVYATLSGIVELAVIGALTGYVPPDPAFALAYLCGQALVLLSLTILLSTRLSAITAGVACLAIFGLAWIGGIIGGIGAAMQEPTIAQVGELSRLLLPTDGLWRGVVYHLEPREMLLLADQAGPLTAAFPFIVETPPPTGFLVWVVAWFAVVLGLAAVSFQRREI